MIVRIMADNQYRIADDQAREIERLDDELNAAIDANDAARFESTLNDLIDHVQRNGQLVGPDELIPSDIMVPSGDMTLGEAKTALQKASVHEQGGTPS